MKIDKRGWSTILVTLCLIAIGVCDCLYFGWLSVAGIVGWVFILIGLMNFLGWWMDLYFNKKYGMNTMTFGKETYPVLFVKDKNYQSQAWHRVQLRKLKDWWNKK